MRVVFVCLGNICRSPAAEGIFLSMLEQQGLQEKFHVDSAGTSEYHQGALADSRMREHAERRGIKLTSRSRKFVSDDFENFDLILVMDRSNQQDVLALAKSKEQKSKVKLMLEYGDSDYTEVPDPYYGGASGFKLVLDLLEGSCEKLLQSLND